MRSFARFRRIDYPDLDRLQKLYEWLFVPITLWPFNVEGLFRAALKRASAGKRLDKSMALVVDLLPPLPSEKTRRAVSEHEHAVQHGNYEPLIRARYKYDQVEQDLARDQKFQTDWNAIKAQFDVTKYADHKRIIRRRLVAERSMREDWELSLEAIHAAKLSKEADARKLKGEARLSWMLKKLEKDSRTDERQLRRILAKARDGI